jgi:small-conductance mechanosensitive channel
VIALLETVARAHPQVLPEPPPKAFFMGYGDSAINFTLFAWPDHFNHWLQVKSDLTAAIYEAVSAAGMSFPLPQREVRVRREAEAAITPVNAAHETERADAGAETEAPQHQAVEGRRRCEDGRHDTARTE